MTKTLYNLTQPLVDAFAARKTIPREFREAQLTSLKKLITDNAAAIVEAVRADLSRPHIECLQAEVMATIMEINHALANLENWMAPEETGAMMNPNHKPLVFKQPKGVALIIGSWNYPFHLLIAPLVPAIAAGCCAVIKPSEVSSNTAALVARLVPKYLDPSAYRVALGGPEETEDMIHHEHFDHIFYTGNGAVGRIVYQAAATRLVSVTLELGGKSPIYVHGDLGEAELDVVAKRVAVTKFMNCGQTCVAPDYVLVDARVAEPFTAKLAGAVRVFYGETDEKTRSSASFGRIINERHFDRLSGLLSGKTEHEVVCGGLRAAERSQRFLPPTLVRLRAPDAPRSKLMREEIFGPVLPLIAVRDEVEAARIINSMPPSLASYCFAKDTAFAQDFLLGLKSGGSVVNDVMSHLATPELPFGGFSGGSGLGYYHGVAGFYEFTHRRAMVINRGSFDPKDPAERFRFPPYSPKVYEGMLGMVSKM